ncbi:hypothetical protein D3C78_1726980 [compost metagenome]
MLYETGHRREQPQYDQHQRHHETYIAAGNAGQLDHAIVLTKAGVGEGVEYCRQHRVQAVSQHTALQALHIQRTADRLFRHVRGGGDIADGFQ